MKEPICIACDITERMTKPKSRPGNRFGSENPCLSVCRQVGSSHCLGILPTMLGPPGRPNIHCSSATGGVHRVHRCYQPHLGRGARADGTMQGLARCSMVEQVNGKIRSRMICRISPGSQTPPGGDQIILLCRRRRPPRDIPLNQPTKISLLKHTMLDRLTIAAPE